MDLNSTRILCDVLKCADDVIKNEHVIRIFKVGIIFHDYNQGLSRYRSKWLGVGKGMGLGMG